MSSTPFSNALNTKDPRALDEYWDARFERIPQCITCGTDLSLTNPRLMCKHCTSHQYSVITHIDSEDFDNR